MRIKIINQWNNDHIEDFELKVNKFCERLEKHDRTIIDIQIIQNNYLIAIVKYE